MTAHRSPRTRVLLIDDERLNALLTEYLGRFNFPVRAVVHPDEGLRAVKADAPDIVIFDVMLPDMDGFAVCRKVRETSRVPIVMLTARGDVTDRIVGLELGADDYVPKPFEPRELLARMQAVLRRGAGGGGGELRFGGEAPEHPTDRRRRVGRARPVDRAGDDQPVDRPRHRDVVQAALLGRLGLVALGLVLLFWVGFRAEEQKSNARDVAARFGPTLERGDLLVSTQPEQVPVLAYYFGDEVAYASPLGPFPDTRVMDWRDVVPKLAAARPETTLEPLLDEVPVGRQVLLVRPLIRNPNAWEAEWTSLVHARTRQWTRVLRRDERFVRTAVVAPPYTEHVPRGIRVEFFTKTRSG